MMPPPKSRSISVPNSARQQLIIAPWRTWESVAVNLTNVTTEVRALDLWRAFKDEGSIRSIVIYEDSHGHRTTRAKTRFRPPPDTDFWKSAPRPITLHNGESIFISMSLDKKALDGEVPSPIRKGVSLPAEVKVPIFSMDLEVLVDETTMMPMRTVGSLTTENAFLVLDLKYKNLLVYFELRIQSTQRPQEYRLKIHFSQLDRFFQTKNNSTGDISHFTFLGSPPEYHRRIQNTENSFGNKETSWREWDAWYRQANIVHNPTELTHLPVGLRRLNPIIDIGRWNAFRINYPRNCNDGGRFSLFCNILSEYNLIVEETNRFKLHDTTKERPIPIWKWIDLDSKASNTSSSSLQELIDTSHIHLPFAVRYLLEVCISHGFLSEYNMTREFALKLAGLEEVQARKFLEHVTTQKKTYYNPMEIFDIKFIKGASVEKIPSYCCLVRSARITPSTVYYNVPSVDISNRVIRRHINLADNFLRVRFTDEKHIGRIHATADDTMDEVLTRIKRALANGVTVGSTRYEFLAFGNSQFREHGAYFFAPKDGVTAASIRAWMGQFNHIRSIAKHTARLGQCFSTTRAISGCTAHVKKIDDIERNGYIFSDGVGRISKFLAQIVKSELKIKTPTKEPPSAYQSRLGGCKGMLIVSPEARLQEVHIRKSQFKFAALSQGLEIIRWSQFTVASLNRQLILVLSTLGITDEVFHLKLRTMLRNLDDAMENDPKAAYFLREYVDPNQVTLTVSQMVLDGFRKTNEPFVTSLLTLWRAWHLKHLKEKAKIVIDKGACVLGCMDETATLKGYFSDRIPRKDALLEEKVAALPEIFLQVYLPEDGGKYKIIEGICILARNPSLHPGDIRVVRAVNAPGLHHLKDVVVLLQTGDRDIASMCSGGDLDGDDFLVIWDQDLLPNDWFRKPFNYNSEREYELDHDVTVDEITSFFVTYIKNDCLPKIAHAHLAWGDYLDDGLNEAKCIRLAQLHSNAVDYSNTGIPAVMIRDLEPHKWPHFMEKNNRPESARYHSKKVLGQLYDAVESIDFVPNLEMDFDKRILNCHVEVPKAMYDFARKLKDEYDIAIRRIMAQHEIKTEFEVWSTFVLSHAKIDKDYKFHEDIGAMSFALRESFKKRAFDKVGGRTFDALAPLAVAMYRVTHKEMAAALATHRERKPSDERLLNNKPALEMEQLPLISFPWIFSKILGQIAVGHYEHTDIATTLSTDLQLNRRTQHQIGEAELDTFSKESDAAKQNPQALGPPEDQPDDDPFGLGLRDDADIATIASNNIPSSDCNIDSLEELLGFGPLNVLSEPSKLLVLASPSVEEGTLLDFDRDPAEGGWEANPKTTAPDLMENQSMHGANKKQNGYPLNPLIVHAAPFLKENKAMNEQNGRHACVVELVEEFSDEDDNPLGLGKLNELAGL
ncbi:RNA dependent RNA polymerase-domain-containing protein [Aspergillus similis]